MIVTVHQALGKFLQFLLNKHGTKTQNTASLEHLQKGIAELINREGHSMRTTHRFRLIVMRDKLSGALHTFKNRQDPGTNT